jgi:excisionase family DNA binding protein
VCPENCDAGFAFGMRHSRNIPDTINGASKFSIDCTIAIALFRGGLSSTTLSTTSKIIQMPIRKNINKNNLHQVSSKNSQAEPSFPWKVEDVAQACCVSVRTVAKWCKGKYIPYIKVGKSVRFSPDAVNSALKKFVVQEASR